MYLSEHGSQNFEDIGISEEKDTLIYSSKEISDRKTLQNASSETIICDIDSINKKEAEDASFKNTTIVNERTEDAAETAESITDGREPEYTEDGHGYNSSVSDNIAERYRRRLALPRKRLIKRIVAMVILLAFFSTFTNLYTITSIEVEGNSYYTDDEIINISHAETGKNLIWNPGKREAARYLEKNPYIDEVHIRRRLPGTLVIKIEERRQIAAVVYGDEYIVIDINGTVLRRTKTKPKLTIVKGIKTNMISDGEMLGTDDKPAFQELLKLLEVMDEGKIFFVKIEVSELHTNAYVYDNLMCSGKTAVIIDFIQNNRLQKMIDKLFKRGIKRGKLTITEKGYASFTPVIN